MDNYKESFIVRSYEADYYGDLTILALCDQIQDAAWNDARRIDWGLTVDQTWVLTRLALEISGPLPRWAEDYSVETWHRGIEKAFGVRDFEITTERSGAVAVATSSWLVIDRVNRRPVRLRGFPEHAPGASQRSVMERSAPRIAKFSWTDQGPFVPVRYGDLDVNRHVNSMTYVRWILDGYSFAFRQTNTLGRLEINFLAEALEDDHVALETVRGSVDEARIIRRRDGEDLCRAKLYWKQQSRDDDP